MKTKFESFGNIHTILGILLAMLLAQTVSAETWFTNEVWISTVHQTNGGAYGVYGNGTLDCPFDGSTQTNFDAVMASPFISSNTTIHLLAGTYQTLGSSSGGYLLKSGQKVLGSGIDNTIIRLVANAQGNGSSVCVMVSVGGCSNNVVSDLTLDCNSSSQTITPYGLYLVGNHHAVRSVKVINSNGNNNYSNGIWIDDGGGQSEGNVVENCEIGPLGCGIYFNGTAYMMSGIIRNNHIFFIPNGSQTMAICGRMRNTLIEGNYVKGALAGYYCSGTNIIVTHNVFENCLAPIFLQSEQPLQNSTFCYNTISSTTSNGIAWAFRFDPTASYTNIAIIGNTITYNGNTPAVPNYNTFLWVNNITGLIVANNMLNPGLTSSISSCTNVSMYNNYDLNGNFYTNLNQVASPNGVTRRTVTYSGTGIYTNYASYADKYIGVNGITSGNSGKVSVVLPSAVGHAGKDFVIVDESGQLSSPSRFIKIQATSPDQINGQSAITNATPYTAKTVISDGTYWFAR